MHVLVDFLEPGSLAMYDFGISGHVYVWQKPVWNILRIHASQTLVSTDLDEPLTTLVDELPARLEALKPGYLTAAIPEDLTQDPPILWNEEGPSALEMPGTLILVIRNCEAWDNFDGWQNLDGTPLVDRHGVLVFGGIAFCPGIQEGQDLGDTPVEYFVEQLCLGIVGKDHDRQIAADLNLPGHHLQARAALQTRVREMDERRKASEAKAKVLLLEHLSEEQKAELAESGFFHTQGKDGYTYRIVFKSLHNIFRVEDGRRTVEYCLVSRDPIPTYDLMLMQKLLLETTPEEFHRVANAWPIDDSGEQFRRILDPTTLRNAPVGQNMLRFMEQLEQATRPD